MNIIKSIFKPRDKPKNHTGDGIGGGRSFPFGRTWSGKSVTERSAMQTTAVYACVRIISETVASLPRIHGQRKRASLYASVVQTSARYTQS